jgi:flagellin-like hook-associated protein FlgL
MRDLSVQAANGGGMNDDAKKSIQSEMTQLKSELNRIADTTTFNGKKLLDGKFNENFQVGANAGETIAVNIGTSMGSAGLKVDGVDVTGAGAYGFDVTGTGGAGKVTVSTAADDATAAILTIEAANSEDWTATGTKADFATLSGTISFGGKSFDLSSVAYDDTADTDASGTVDGADLLAQLNTAAKSALGLSTDPFTENGGNLEFSVTEAVAGYTEAAGDAIDDGAGNATADQIAKATATFTAASGASSAISAIDTAIKSVSTQRADLGAIQNRFDHTINNLNVAVENLTASESRIRDADMAQEMVQFTRNQILSQAGTAMLAQANQASQGVLSLLR